MNGSRPVAWRDHDAVLFDLDGVLTPTAEVHMRAWAEMFDAFLAGLDDSGADTSPYSDADYFAHVDGKPRYDGVRDFLTSRGIRLPEGDPADPPDAETVCGLGNRKNDAFNVVLERDGVDPYPGSVALLDTLRAMGMPLAVVSSSANAPAVLDAARLADRFVAVVDGRVAGELGLPGKPAPDTFVHAATLCGTSPDRSVVVEDAVSGVRAGAAGDFALVIGVDRGAGADVLTEAGAQVVVTDLGGARVKAYHVDGDPIDRSRFPVDPWRFVECDPDRGDLGVTETLFTVANGYIGMRGNPEEGRDAHEHGTFINGFHETWPIRHAETAFGFARTGQTIVNVPDSKLMKLYVDDEPLVIGTADLEHYERSLDFRDGVLRRSLVWRTPSGKRVRVDSTRMVSMTQRHLAVLTLEVTMISGDAPVIVSSQLLNRQDGRDEYHEPAQSKVAAADPRKAGVFEGRVLEPKLHLAHEDRMMLGYRAANSGMTVAVAADHTLATEDPYEVILRDDPDLTKMVFRVDAREGRPVRVEKTVAYHTSRSLPVRELADRCDRTLDRAARYDLAHYRREQREWYDRFWAASDVEVASDEPGHDGIQQAIRYNLFTLAQASGRADGQGVPAKGVTGSGYEGHYFWDSEVYVAPFLTYTSPELARNLMHFRSMMLPAARDRARELSQRGALFPWRTINGEEASAYYAAGTAQVHIDADVVHALVQYVNASGDVGFLLRDGLQILVETARLYADLGFWRNNGERSFHIHGVTGPDEYTTVVNNNLFTNVMARYNLEQAVTWVEWARRDHPVEFGRLAAKLDLDVAEIAEWADCAAGMHIPFDEGLGIHPQDDFFLDREVWDLSRTPDELRPLLLHYHPLVIYRFQVLKQADVVLALFLQGDRFTAEEKRKDFEYYDPITTGDSTLSAVVQSVIAAEVGYHDVAYFYFLQALFVDLADLHRNTVDGLHVASTGGVWSALVNGFGGLRDHDGRLRLAPRLPDHWTCLTFRLTWRGSRVRFAVTGTSLSMVVEEGETPVPVEVHGRRHVVAPGEPVVLELDCHGPRITRAIGDRPKTGGTRADGSRITAGVPDPMPLEEGEVPEPVIGETGIPDPGYPEPSTVGPD